MAELHTDLRSAPTDPCIYFGTGHCCRDRCRSLDGIPEAAVNALDLPLNATTLCGDNEFLNKTEQDPTKVSCPECRERMFS